MEALLDFNKWITKIVMCVRCGYEWLPQQKDLYWKDKTVSTQLHKMETTVREDHTEKDALARLYIWACSTDDRLPSSSSSLLF